MTQANAQRGVAVLLHTSDKVKIQKRKVYNIFAMFGNVGGLMDFFSLILASIFGFYSDKFLEAQLVQKLFHFQKGKA